MCAWCHLMGPGATWPYNNNDNIPDTQTISENLSGQQQPGLNDWGRGTMLCSVAAANVLAKDVKQWYRHSHFSLSASQTREGQGTMTWRFNEVCQVKSEDIKLSTRCFLYVDHSAGTWSTQRKSGQPRVQPRTCHTIHKTTACWSYRRAGLGEKWAQALLSYRAPPHN